MKRSVLHFIVCVLGFSLLRSEGAAAASLADPRRVAAVQLFRAIGDDLSDPSDRTALEELLTVVTEHGTLTDDHMTAWMRLTFDEQGRLVKVTVNTRVLFNAPALLQQAAILHELEHIKSAKDTRRLIGKPSQVAFDALPVVDPVPLHDVSHLVPANPAHHAHDETQRSSHAGAQSAAKLQHIVRVLVNDEFRAYARDILYVSQVVGAHGGLAAYLATLPPAHRLSMQRYYERHVQPFVTTDGTIDDQRLRRDFIFLQTFPRQFPRYYEAALAWEALQGHVEVRLGQDGQWHPTRLCAPDAFLAWLVP